MYIKKLLKKVKKQSLKFVYAKKYKKYKKYCKDNKQKEFLIFNSPIHGNIGDHAIIYAEQKLLEQYSIKTFEIPTFEEQYCFDYLKENISEDAIISITGGGFIGSEWIIEQNLVNKVVKEYYNHKILIFPCTMYFKNDEFGKEQLHKSKEILEKAYDINIFAREEKTYQFTKDNYSNAKIYLVPDIVLNLKETNEHIKRDGILICLRKDIEKNLTDEKVNYIINAAKDIDNNLKYTDTVVDYAINIKNREKEIKNKLDEFSKSKLVITDRLHGMIFAYITNTPCIVLSNYNYKVEGVYQWLKDKQKNIIYEKEIDNIKQDIHKLYNDNSKEERKALDFSKIEEFIKDI